MTSGIKGEPGIPKTSPNEGESPSKNIKTPKPKKYVDLDDTMESLRKYHLILDKLEADQSLDNPDFFWKIREIADTKIIKNTENRPRYFFKVIWIDGDKQWVSMDDLRLHDPISLMRYGLSKGMLHKPGWKWVQNYLNVDKEHMEYARAYKASVTGVPVIKFGVRVPKTVQEALALDKENGDNLWKEAIDQELGQIMDFDTFRVAPDGEYLPGYKRIPYHIVFDVKFDGRRKARLVAGGHRTDPLKEDVFSGVVSMEAVRLGFILAKMNDLLVCAGDIGNAFLNGYTREKYYVVAGPEFGPEYV